MNQMDLKQSNGFRLALELSIITGAITIALVYMFGQTGNPQLFTFATQLGGMGNDIFLLATNGIIFAWAWRNNRRGVIGLTLAMDAAVWAIVQSIKLIPFGAWALRPNGDIGGFPSGHTTHAFAMAFALTTIFPRFGWVWYLGAGIIGWSRVESAWHTPFQVTAGVFFGIAVGVTFVKYLLKKYAGPPHTTEQA
jgi:membrane-associated phospholipid phosphatase